MDGTAQLLVVLAAIYLSDCVAWNRRGSLGLRALAGGRFRAALPSRTAGNPRAGLVWANPLPPLGTLFVCEPAPLAFGPDGAAVLEPLELDRGPREAIRARAWSYSELGDLLDSGKELIARGEVVARAATDAAAAEAARNCRELSALPRGERTAAIERLLERSLDPDAARAAAERFEERVGRLRIASNALLVHLALVTPATLSLAPLSRSWPWLAASLLALHALVVVLAWRARSRSQPEERVDALAFGLLCAVSPPQAIRALDLLARPVLARFHPLAAAALLGREDRERIARATLVHLRHPRELPDDSLLRATAAWHRERMLALVEPVLGKLGIDGAKLLAAPAPEDESRVAWCPRCQSQFAEPGGSCLDCGVETDLLVAGNRRG